MTDSPATPMPQPRYRASTPTVIGDLRYLATAPFRRRRATRDSARRKAIAARRAHADTYTAVTP